MSKTILKKRDCGCVEWKEERTKEKITAKQRPTFGVEYCLKHLEYRNKWKKHQFHKCGVCSVKYPKPTHYKYCWKCYHGYLKRNKDFDKAECLFLCQE